MLKDLWEYHGKVIAKQLEAKTHKMDVDTEKLREQIEQDKNDEDNDYRELNYTLMEHKAKELRFNELMVAKLSAVVQDEFAGLPADLKLAKRKLEEQQ